MKKCKDWWIQDKRYLIMIKAVLLALLPVLCCTIYCAMDGKTLGQVWLPGCEWNDELFYYKQVEGIVNYGYPLGYFGFNESHALKLSFAAWSPVLVFPWIFWGFLFGWNLLSPILCNIALLSLACFLFVWLVKPTGKQVALAALLLGLYTPLWRYTLSAMPEVICISLTVIFYSLAINYSSGGNVYKLVLLFVMAAVMTLMRPYFLLLLLLPGFYLIRKKGALKGIIGSGAILAVILGLYAVIKHFFGAEYFAPLFFTDWIDAFFERGIFGGIAYSLGKMFYSGKTVVAYTVQAFRTGLYAGAFFGAFFAVVFILLLQTAKEAKAKCRSNAYIAQLHLTFSCFALFVAILLMYKITEGSRHLHIFVVAGILFIAMMKTAFFKKVVFTGSVFAYLFAYMPSDPLVYNIPYVESGQRDRLKSWEEVFDRELHLNREGEIPSFDNVIIWVMADQDKAGVTKQIDWQMLYALPEGFGISCCEGEYCLENIENLQSKYIATLTDGELDKVLRKRGYRRIGADSRLSVYELH